MFDTFGTVNFAGGCKGGTSQPFDFNIGSPFGGGPPSGDFEGLSGPLRGYGPAAPTETKLSPEEKERRDRAKRASRIFRKICGEAGLSNCFFGDFNTWSEFVEGRMSEGDFSEHAMSVARAMAGEISKQREEQSRN